MAALPGSLFPGWSGSNASDMFVAPMGEAANPFDSSGLPGSVDKSYETEAPFPGTGLVRPDLLTQGTNKPGKEANSSITNTVSISNRRLVKEGFPILPMESARAQMVWLYNFPLRRLGAGAPLESRAGSTSSTNGLLTWSQMNYMLATEFGKTRYPGRDASILTRDWCWHGCEMNMKGVSGDDGTRTVTFAKECLTQNWWAEFGMLKTASTLWALIIKVTNDGTPLSSPVRPLTDEEKKYPPMRQDVLRSRLYSAAMSNSKECPIYDNEHWRIVPWAGGIGESPDISLYNNEHFIGVRVFMGTFQHFDSIGDYNRAESIERVRKVLYPESLSGDWQFPMMKLPAITCFIRHT